MSSGCFRNETVSVLERCIRLPLAPAFAEFFFVHIYQVDRHLCMKCEVTLQYNTQESDMQYARSIQ